MYTAYTENTTCILFPFFQEQHFLVQGQALNAHSCSRSWAASAEPKHQLEHDFVAQDSGLCNAQAQRNELSCRTRCAKA